jgi:ubiquinone/menaquinone biosynthesis C-methylase UbiE
MLRALVLAAGTAVLAACAGSADDAAKNEQAAQPTAAQKTVIDAQLKALEKAKGVQKTVDDQKQATDKAVDDAGG